MIKKNKDTRNSKVLADFVKYCEAHPELRFWQALMGWVRSPIVLVKDDPFNWEGKDSWEEFDEKSR